MAYSPFKMKGSPMQRNFGIGASPTKKMKGTKGESKETTYSYMEDPKRERTDKHGRTQKEVLEMRTKKERDYVDNVKNYAEKHGGLTEEEAKKARNKADKLSKETVFSADSIAGVNKELARQAELAMKKKNKKKSDEFDAL